MESTVYFSHGTGSLAADGYWLHGGNLTPASSTNPF